MSKNKKEGTVGGEKTWDRSDPSFYEGLGAFTVSESGAFLLQSVRDIGKARQGLAGSLLLCADGEWAYVPLAANSLTDREGGHMDHHFILLFHVWIMPNPAPRPA